MVELRVEVGGEGKGVEEEVEELELTELGSGKVVEGEGGIEDEEMEVEENEGLLLVEKVGRVEEGE